MRELVKVFVKYLKWEGYEYDKCLFFIGIKYSGFIYIKLTITAITIKMTAITQSIVVLRITI